MADNTNNIQEIQNSEKLLDLSNKILDTLNQRKKLIKDINQDEQLYFATVKQQQKLSQDIVANAEKYLGYQIKSKDLAKQIKAVEDNQAKTRSSFLKENNNQVSLATKLEIQRQDALKKALDIRKQIKGQTDLISKLDEKNQNLQVLKNVAEKNGDRNLAKSLQTQIRENQRIADNKEKNVKLLETQFNKEKDLAKTARETVEYGKKVIEDQAKELGFLEKNLIIRKRIEKSTGLLGGLSKSLAKIPGIGKYLNADEAIDEMEKLAAKIEESGSKSTDFGNRLQIGLKGASVLAKGFAENLKSPEAIILFLVSAINKADQQATKLGRELGISKDQAYGLRENFVAYSRAVNDGFINTDRLAKAQSELSEQLGIAVQYSGEELTTFSKLTEIVGLSAQEAGKLASFSAAAGMSSTDYVKQLRLSSFYTQQANKVHFSDKQILQDISGLSAGILIKFQNNPKALAAAVIQAKALGLTLQQVDKVGDSLLNWESSIENQLKAQLLTGKQLNLEKARYLALTGSQAELSQEISKQAGSLADFQNMNVIAQKSLAEAFGMSRDELADMLMKQEAITKYGSKAAELNKEQLEYMKEHNLSADQMLDKVTNQRSVQEKFNDAMLKLQDVIGNLVAGPLGQFVSFLAKGLDYITGIAIAFGSIYALQKGIAAYQAIIAVSKGEELAVQLGIAAAWAIANPFTALAGLAIAGGVASLVASQMNAAPKFADGGIVTSPITNATIGEAGPEAIIPLNSPKANSMMGGMDLTPMINAINEVRTAVTALANRPINSVINIDGKAIGTAVGKQQETGTAQNIYTGYRMA
jgi:hypothetical protein